MNVAFPDQMQLFLVTEFYIKFNLIDSSFCSQIGFLISKHAYIVVCQPCHETI